MTRLTLSQHGRDRMTARGLSSSDLELILLFGTEVEDGLLVLKRDRDAAIEILKHLIHRVERLTCQRIVTRDGVLVTAFRARPDQLEQMLAPDRRRDLRQRRRPRR